MGCAVGASAPSAGGSRGVLHELQPCVFGRHGGGGGALEASLVVQCVRPGFSCGHLGTDFGFVCALCGRGVLAKGGGAFWGSG